jgi:Ca2+-binding RTX toxin-like protein
MRNWRKPFPNSSLGYKAPDGGSEPGFRRTWLPARQMGRRMARVIRLATVVALASLGLVATCGPAYAATCQSMTATITGTAGDDVRVGTAGPDVVSLFAGNDTFSGRAGNDVVCAGAGDDAVVGEDGDDRLFGEGGDVDLLHGGAGNDTLNGGPGIADGAAFFLGAQVNANLSINRATGQGTDTLAAMEGLAGSSGKDTLTSNGASFNHFTGDLGNDTIDGGAGLDAVLFLSDTQEVYVDLAAGTATGGDGSDVLKSIQVVSGTDLADDLFGASSADTLLGGEGADTLRGRGGNDALNGEGGNDEVYGDAGSDELRGGTGNDELVGGTGTHDLAVYTTATQTINASLATGTATGEGSDTLKTIEDLTGSDFADVLRGSGGPNRIAGRTGNDQLFGLGGSDLLNGGDGNDTVTGGSGSDYCVGESTPGCELTPTDPGAQSVSATAAVEGGSTAPLMPAEQPPPTPSMGDPIPAVSGDGGAYLGGQVRSAMGGSSIEAATDSYVIDLFQATNYEPPECYRGSRQTRVPTSQAEGISWRADLYYWDANAQSWYWTGASYGPIRAAAYNAGY